MCASAVVDCVWNKMAHVHKPDFVFRRNERVHLSRGALVQSSSGRQAVNISLQGLYCRARLCSAVTWHLLVTPSILLFPLHFSSRTSPCAITFQLDSNTGYTMFRGSVKGTGYPLHSPVSPSLPLSCVTVCHHISLDCNTGYTMFRGSVKGTGYTLHSPVCRSLPLKCVTVYDHISNGIYLLMMSSNPARNMLITELN